MHDKQITLRIDEVFNASVNIVKEKYKLDKNSKAIRKSVELVAAHEVDHQDIAVIQREVKNLTKEIAELREDIRILQKLVSK